MALDLVILNSVNQLELVVGDGNSLELVFDNTQNDLELQIGGEQFIRNAVEGISANGGAITNGTAVFSNANNISWGISGNYITASASFSGDTGAQSSLVYSNSNNISFTVNNSTLVASASFNQTSLVYSNSNGVSFGVSDGTLTASVNPGAGIAGTISAGTQTFQLGEAVFSNSNNVSWSMNNGTIVASASFAQSSQSQSSLVYSNSNNVTFGTNGSTLTASASFPAQTQFVLSNSNGITFGTNGSTVTASYTVPTVPAQTAYVFSNSNGLTFGTNGSTVTGSYTVPSVPAQTQQPMYFSASGTSTSSNTIQFGNSNGVSFSLSNGSIVATVATDYQSSNANYLTSQSGQAFSASGGSSAFQTLNFANSNGFTFSNSNGSIIASYTVPTVSNSSLSITAGNGSSLGSLSQLYFSNANSLSFGLSTSNNGSATLTGSFSYTQQALTNSSLTMQAGASTLSSVSRIAFGDSNGISFGASTSNNGSITITATVKTDYQSSNANYLTSQSNQAVSAQGGSSAFQTLIFTNSNGFSFSNTGGSIWGSYTVPTLTNSSLSITAGNGSSIGSLSQLYFSNANSLSFGLSTSNNGSATLTASFSYTQQALTNSSLTMQAGASTLSSVSRIAFGDSNGISFGASTSNNGSITITATVKTDYQSSNANYLTSQSNQAFSAQGGSSAFQTLAFTNSNGFSFSNTGGSIWGSYTVPTLTNSSLSITAGNGTSIGSLSQLYFSNANGLSFGLSTSNNGSATLTASYTVPTLAASPVAISAGTASASLSSIVFSNSNGFSFGLNGSTITGSQGNNRVSYFDNMGNFGMSNQSAMGLKAMQASTLWVFPLCPGDVFPGDITVSTLFLDMAISGSAATMSSAQTSNFTFGIYTILANQTQLGLASSATYNWSTNAGNANFSTNFAGNRFLPLTKNNWGGSTEPVFSQNVKYFGAFVWSSAGQVNNVSNSIFGNYGFSSAARSGTIGASTGNSTWFGFYPAMGHYSANTTALPSSIGISELNKQVSSANFMPHVILNAMTNLLTF